MGKNLQNTVKFHLWRHLGATMIRRIEPEQMSPAPIIERLKRELGPFFRDMDGDQAVIDTELEEIASLAVMLDIRMQTEKAHFCVLFCHPETFDQHDFPSEPEEGSFSMLLDIFQSPADAGKTVDLVVSPLLRRRGTEEGLDYDKFNDVMPMRVVVSENLDEFSRAIPMTELPAFLAKQKQEQQPEQSPDSQSEPRYKLRIRSPRAPAKVMKSNRRTAAAGRKASRLKPKNDKNDGEKES
jgi:hypothetical protein